MKKALLLFVHTFVTSSTFAKVVAVVDTGLDVQHKQFKEQLWTNQGESGLDDKGQDRATNGLDDDHNGYIDDVHGWNFVNNTNNLDDEEGHGTHISGLISSTSNRTARLMILKYYDAKASDDLTLKRSNQALEYAIKMKAQIINYSGGGVKSDPMERDLIFKAFKNKITIVAASGNTNSNIDIQPFYPASYPLPNVIAVGAIDSRGRKARFSNYGPKTIDRFEQGVKVLSAAPGQKYILMSGTSQATAIATGKIVIDSKSGETSDRLRLGLNFDMSK